MVDALAFYALIPKPLSLTFELLGSQSVTQRSMGRGAVIGDTHRKA